MHTMTREQQLQFLCLHPSIAIELIEDFIQTDGAKIECKRPKVREDLVYLLLEFCNLMLPPSYAPLIKEFRRFLIIKKVFKQSF